MEPSTEGPEEEPQSNQKKGRQKKVKGLTYTNMFNQIHLKIHQQCLKQEALNVFKCQNKTILLTLHMALKCLVTLFLFLSYEK